MFPRAVWGSHVWCVMVICWVCRFKQTALKLSVREKWCATFLKALTGTGFSLVGIGRLSMV
jgi:hypothetical protein